MGDAGENKLNVSQGKGGAAPNYKLLWVEYCWASNTLKNPAASVELRSTFRTSSSMNTPVLAGRRAEDENPFYGHPEANRLATRSRRANWGMFG